VDRLITTLNLLLGRHLKAREIGDAKGGRHRDVRGITTAAHDNAMRDGYDARLSFITQVLKIDLPSKRQTGGHAMHESASFGIETRTTL
jgi:hypothetical protein